MERKNRRGWMSLLDRYCENTGQIIPNCYVIYWSDIEAVAEAVKPAERSRIHIVVSASNIHRESKLRKSKDEVLQMGVDAVRCACNLCADVEYSTEDASRADLDYLCVSVSPCASLGLSSKDGDMVSEERGR